MMNNIEQIVMNVLESHSGNCLDNEEEREVVAIQVSTALIQQSLGELAALLGGSVERDNDGRAVIYTDICAE